MLETERYYRILELQPGASPEEVHQGYLDLTWVWHPDRFVGHPRLQKKAHHKLQELNEAHEQLRSFQATLRKWDLRAKSKPQAYRRSNDKSLRQEFSQPKKNQASSANYKKKNNKSVRRVVSKASDFDEWLD